MDGPDPGRQNSVDDEQSETLFHSRRRRCCFSFTCFDRNPSPSPSAAAGSSWWQRVRTAEIYGGGDSKTLWGRGVGALKKIREWSEIVAGPRWKTFIRRFNRNRGGGRHANFQYDPLSYAMNFDDGPGQNGHLHEEGEDGYRNFSSRYAAAKGGSMDLTKDGPTFV